MTVGKKLRAEEVKTLAFGSIGATYTAIGSAISNTGVALHVQNLTDTLLMFSYDGVTDHFPLAANSVLVLDVTSNKPSDNGLFISVGTTLYVREIVSPTTGAVYVTLYYGKD